MSGMIALKQCVDEAKIWNGSMVIYENDGQRICWGHPLEDKKNHANLSLNKVTDTLIMMLYVFKVSEKEIVRLHAPSVCI